MNPQNKPGWKTPELTVLVRSNPQELVLTSCKHETHGGLPTSEDTIHNGCSKEGVGCVDCETLGDS